MGNFANGAMTIFEQLTRLAHPCAGKAFYRRDSETRAEARRKLAFGEARGARKALYGYGVWKAHLNEASNIIQTATFRIVDGRVGAKQPIVSVRENLDCLRIEPHPI